MESERPGLALLWWLGITRPERAFDAVARRPAPLWGFVVIVGLNLVISLTTELVIVLSGEGPYRRPYITFIPVDRYYLAQMLFLPALRTVVALLGAAVVHLGLRLSGRHSDVDLLLNLFALVNLVVIPVVLVIDWLGLALGTYHTERHALLHGAVALALSALLTVRGLRHLLGVSGLRALALFVLSTAVTLPILATFALP